jgi:general secretion pathway protein N
VVGEFEAIAVFLDHNHAVIRLRRGQDYSGWVLNSVKGREATLQKDRETAVFALPAPGADDTPAASVPTPQSSAAAAPSGHLIKPQNPGDFAPFVPRSTPKNGASDGL